MRDRNNWIVLPSLPGRPAGLAPYDLLEVDGLAFGRCPDGRFMADRCLLVTDEAVLLLDGVVLNKADLLGQAGQDAIGPALLGLIGSHGLNPALAALRGPFSGVLYDRAARVLHVFGNHTGDSAGYLYVGAPGVIASNSADLILRLLPDLGVTPAFDEQAALTMLTYGFMLGSETFARKVRRVPPGAVVAVPQGSGEAVTSRYWQLGGVRREVAAGFEEAVADLDRLFRQATARCFDKDLEYGYPRHLVDLSGGLDSRMVNVVARDLGYRPVTNISYSESTSDEARYAIREAARLGQDLLFHSLDGGWSLLDPAGTLQLNSGAAYYGGITGGRTVLQSLDFTEFGLEHTGQLGDVVVGTFAASDQRRAPAPGAGAYSRLAAFTPDPSVLGDDEELFLMHTRGFRGALSTHLLRQHFTYPVSPFIDVDLLDYVFNLPLGWRVGHRLYAAWVATCYPSALAVPTTRVLPGQGGPGRHLAHQARRIAGGGATRIQRWLNNNTPLATDVAARLANNMNPAESWYATNPELRALIDEARGRAAVLPVGPPLAEALARSLGREGTIWDKLLAVTVTTMHGLYFEAGPDPGQTGGFIT